MSGGAVNLCPECARGYHINHESGGWVLPPESEPREQVGKCLECDCRWPAALDAALGAPEEGRS